MHDGQMLLMLNLNKTSWDADDTFGIKERKN
jgi:hypothetical protein